MNVGWFSDSLANLSIPLIGLGTLGVMLLAAVGGQSLRKWQESRARRKGRESEESVAQEGYLLSSALGLLGLLMAFSFGMVLNRYETRRQLVTTEANAIGTAYLRAQFLDEPHRSRLSGLLIEYADNRITLGSAKGDAAKLMTNNDRLLTEIWSAVRASRESAVAHGVTTALLMAFNDVIDLDTERKLAWELRVPGEVLALLLLYLAITAALVGHQVDGPRGRRAAFVLFLLIALSITVITDINRPMSGRARESQHALEMALQSLRSQPPSGFDTFTSHPRLGSMQQDDAS